MRDESATAYWLTEVRSLTGHKIPKTESRVFKNRQAAVKFVMEELGSQQKSAWIVTASGLRFGFDIIKQMYTPRDGPTH